MKVTLNVTLQGISADYAVEFDGEPRDEDVKRTALELVRSGAQPGLHLGGLAEDAFAGYVVDRFHTAEGGRRLFLRPKVPFGAR